MNNQNNSELPPIYHGGPEQSMPTDQLAPDQDRVAEITSARAVEQGVSSAAPQMPLPQPVQPVAANPSQPVMPLPMGPQIADDVDLIEKEWVIKAKAIVEQTKHDPREQSRQMNHFKADYLRQRFNKEVRLDEV